MRSLIFTSSQMQQMIAYVNRHAPMESCGLLAGRNATVEKIFEVTNQAQSPVRFVMNPLEQLTAFEWIDANEMDLLGIFHSHPTGPETVSATDIAEAAYAVVYVVLSPLHSSWQAKGFWLENGDFKEVLLTISG